MEIRVLRYFLAVVREENISKAAQILHITQPTLSRQMSELEEDLGASLFIRGKRKISLTDAGMLLRRRAEEIVALADKTQAEFSVREELLGGCISIGSGEMASSRFLPRLLDSFSRKYPQVQYDIYTGNADSVKERIDQGLIDVALLLEPVEMEKYDFIRLPYREKWGILMRADCPLAQKEGIEARDLVGEPIICTTRAAVQNEIASWFGKYYKELNIFATHNLIGNTAHLVEYGLGVGITIEGSVSIYHNPSLIFKPFVPEFSSTSVLAWKKYQPSSPAVGRFIQEAIMLLEHDGP